MYLYIVFALFFSFFFFSFILRCDPMQGCSAFSGQIRPCFFFLGGGVSFPRNGGASRDTVCICRRNHDGFFFGSVQLQPTIFPAFLSFLHFSLCCHIGADFYISLNRSAVAVAAVAG